MQIEAKIRDLLSELQSAVESYSGKLRERLDDCPDDQTEKLDAAVTNIDVMLAYLDDAEGYFNDALKEMKADVGS
jgi:hypothetical protein